MKLKILSDLHLEAPRSYDVYKVTCNDATHLALIGDIGNTAHTELFDFLEAQLRIFRVVFFLLGNHEPYHSSWEASKRIINDFAARSRQQAEADATLGQFVFLDQTRYDVSTDLTVLGCTLYSKVLSAQHDYVSFGLNDFYHIENWTVEKHNDAHASDLSWLNQEIARIAEEEPHRKVVVLTHHSPTTDARSVDPAHANSKISSGFCTDLSAEPCWRSDAVILWAFGHTHFNCDYWDGGKRVMTNQRGYYFAQAADLKTDQTIDI